jgi:putative transposase
VAQVACNLGLQEASSQDRIEAIGRALPRQNALGTLSRMTDQRREFTDQRYVFFITYSVYRRRNLLELDWPKRIVLGVLNHQLEAMRACCVGFVVMPNHLHALVWLPDPNELRRFIHGWKRMSSYRIRN